MGFHTLKFWIFDWKKIILYLLLVYCRKKSYNILSKKKSKSMKVSWSINLNIKRQIKCAELHTLDH